MHAIVMVHKMQRMALSSHQLLPTNAGAEKADSENTRNSETNDHHQEEDEGDDKKGDRALYQ